MRLRHIEVFNAVMLTGSVSAAARMINVTQPAVSRTLQHAELQLGFPLFQRAGSMRASWPASSARPATRKREPRRAKTTLRCASVTLTAGASPPASGTPSVRL